MAVFDSTGRHATFKHGMTRTTIYRLWNSMRQRCYNPSAFGYSRYGGRGIKVCERWQSFENFFDDMSPRPSPQHSLDRIDNDGDYCPENCRWATNKQQSRNMKTNVLLTVNDKTLCVTEWAELTGISRKTIYERLNRGWSADRAVSAPVK